jgi:transcriptional regulator with XRE-family HTH domain
MDWHNATQMAELSDRLAQNVRQLREARGATQAELARLGRIPRATWAHLESGAGNPTLAVLCRVAEALQVSLEELLAQPRASAKHYPASALVSKTRGTVTLRKLLPDPLPGMDSIACSCRREVDSRECPTRRGLASTWRAKRVKSSWS